VQHQIGGEVAGQLGLQVILTASCNNERIINIGLHLLESL